MNIGDIRDLLNADIIAGENKLDVEVKTAFAADLMSDVLSFAKPGALLLTGLTNPLVIRTADTMNLLAIVFVRGKRPLEEAVDLAIQKNIPLLATGYIMFEACGKLYQSGICSSVKYEY